ncbi:hypothetical protein ADUPG1_002266 [Aduncisulcus paluster]|uniref:Transmembrane protein n=1 Tax=Aduncisulcus paluster TaxID=2918883 RepID=A0ABQ5KIK2_9EUKA|nr:hypothetical protein ADUPG1_002266 [Aduncisulcus paluster]
MLRSSVGWYGLVSKFIGEKLQQKVRSGIVCGLDDHRVSKIYGIDKDVVQLGSIWFNLVVLKHIIQCSSGMCRMVEVDLIGRELGVSFGWRLVVVTSIGGFIGWFMMFITGNEHGNDTYMEEIP